MFRKKCIVEGLKKGFLLEKDLIIGQVGKELKQISLLQNQTIVSISSTNDRIQVFAPTKNGYLGVTDEAVIYFNKSLLKNKTVDVESGGDEIFESRYLISAGEFNSKTLEGKDGLFDLEIQDNLWETDFGGMLVTNNARDLFVVSLSEINRRSFLEGSILWAYTIEGELKGIFPSLIGTTGDLAIFGIESLDKLIALDLKTGALKWEREAIPNFYQVDSEHGSLKVITSTYKNINSISGEVIDRSDDRSYFQEIGITSQRNNYAIVGEHIITTDYCKGVIGAFNTVTHKFDWVHHEEGVSFPAGSPIRYSDPYLFVQDNKGDLHVFERR